MCTKYELYVRRQNQLTRIIITKLIYIFPFKSKRLKVSSVIAKDPTTQRRRQPRRWKYTAASGYVPAHCVELRNS